MTVLPPRNLPSGAEPWGRHVETRLRGLRESWRDDSNSVLNLERSTSGQLATSSGLIEELLFRSTEVIRPRDMSATGNQTAEPFPRDCQTVSFAPTPGVRSAFFFFSGWASSSDNGSSSLLFARSQGVRLLRLNPTAPVGPVESSGRQYVSGFCRLMTPNNLPVIIELEFVREPRSLTSSVTLSDIAISLTRSGAV